MRRRATTSPLTARIGAMRQGSLLDALVDELDAAPAPQRPTPRSRAVRRAIIARRRVPIDPLWSVVFGGATEAEWSDFLAENPQFRHFPATAP